MLWLSGESVRDARIKDGKGGNGTVGGWSIIEDGYGREERKLPAGNIKGGRRWVRRREDMGKRKEGRGGWGEAYLGRITLAHLLPSSGTSF